MDAGFLVCNRFVTAEELTPQELLAEIKHCSGQPVSVNISSSTYEIIKDKFPCVQRGKPEAKNKGLIEMYFVDSENNGLT